MPARPTGGGLPPLPSHLSCAAEAAFRDFQQFAVRSRAPTPTQRPCGQPSLHPNDARHAASHSIPPEREEPLLVVKSAQITANDLLHTALFQKVNG